MTAYVTVNEAARMVGVHHATIRQWIRDGVLTEKRLANRSLQIAVTELAGLSRPSFWDYVSEDANDCWIWQGRMVKGYGTWTGLAHRWAYEELRAEIPDGLEIDHLCRVTACVNPWHLEPVSRLENARRRFALQTHCKSGHEFTPSNTYLRDGKYRTCRACNAAAQARRKHRRAA